MNAIHQISLKLQLGLDPSCKIQSEQLLEQWQAFNARRCRARAMERQTNQASAGTQTPAPRQLRSN